MPQPFFTEPNVTVSTSKASVPNIVLLYNGTVLLLLHQLPSDGIDEHRSLSFTVSRQSADILAADASFRLIQMTELVEVYTVDCSAFCDSSGIVLVKTYRTQCATAALQFLKRRIIVDILFVNL